MTASSPSRVVAITGASGMLGRHLCDHLRRRGWQVRGLVRDTSAYPFAEEGVQLFQCDLPEVLDESALGGAEVLIHCAYTTRFTGLDAARRVNEGGTARVLAAARKAEVRRFIFISSTSAHADARSYYGKSKYALERELDPARDLVLRPGLVLAPEDGLYQRIREVVARLRVIPLLGGRQVIQTVHVADFCEAAERALELDTTGVLTIAEPEGVTMRELLRLTAELLGRRPLLIPVPLAPVHLALRVVEALRLPFPFSSENVLGLAGMRHVPNDEDLARLGVRMRTARESLAALDCVPPLPHAGEGARG